MQHRHHKHRGFTLIEILLVITIIGIIILMSALPAVRYLKSSRDLKRKADLSQLATAIELYRTNEPNSQYPESLSDTNMTNIIEYIATNQQPKDPVSNQPYTYQPVCPNNLCTAYTLATKLEIAPVSNTCPTDLQSAHNYCVTNNGSTL